MKMKISRKFDFENQKSNFNVFLMKHILTDPGHTKPCSNCSTNMNSFRSRDHPVRLTLLPSAFRNEETETRPIEMTYSYQIPRRLRSWGLYPQAGPGRHGFSASSEPLFPRRRPCSFRHTGANSLLGPPPHSLMPAGLPKPISGASLWPAMLRPRWPSFPCGRASTPSLGVRALDAPLLPRLPSWWEGAASPGSSDPSIGASPPERDLQDHRWREPTPWLSSKTTRPILPYLCGKYNSLVFFLVVRLFTMILFSSDKKWELPENRDLVSFAKTVQTTWSSYCLTSYDAWKW